LINRFSFMMAANFAAFTMLGFMLGKYVFS
jgi:hypothetical protein